MNRYDIYFEGRLTVYAESEEEAYDKAPDIIDGDGRTRLDHNCSIENIEIIDCVEEED